MRKFILPSSEWGAVLRGLSSSSSEVSRILVASDGALSSIKRVLVIQVRTGNYTRVLTSTGRGQRSQV